MRQIRIKNTVDESKLKDKNTKKIAVEQGQQLRLRYQYIRLAILIYFHVFQRDEHISNIAPTHSSLQGTVSNSLPAHGRPPFIGGGDVQVLVRKRWQVGEQGDQSDHGDQRPSRRHVRLHDRNSWEIHEDKSLFDSKWDELTSSSPEQYAPPFKGAGLLHVRVRLSLGITSEPASASRARRSATQSATQAPVHEDHTDQPPFTES